MVDTSQTTATYTIFYDGSVNNTSNGIPSERDVIIGDWREQPFFSTISVDPRVHLRPLAKPAPEPRVRARRTAPRADQRWASMIRSFC